MANLARESALITGASRGIGRATALALAYAGAYVFVHYGKSHAMRITEKGCRVFVPIFRQHAALIKRAFQDVSPDEQRQMEEVLKRIERRAEDLGEEQDHR